ncbi:MULTISPECIES: hypothetical protein [Brucella]|uniref:hypothetical protein n=1 Tax=Brucella TaxID=234 RepID=UPI001FFCCEC7|nr:hypothetical protein [Brucella intermedia]
MLDRKILKRPRTLRWIGKDSPQTDREDYLAPNGDKSALVADPSGDQPGILQIAQGGGGIKLKPREELNRKQISEIEQVEILTNP